MNIHIEDFEFVNYTVEDTGVLYTFRFSKRPESNVGGYRLYKKYNLKDDVVYETIIIDSSANTDDDVIRSYNEGDYTYFNYYINKEDFGKIIYLGLTFVTRLWAESILSNVIKISTPPLPVSNFTASFDNKNVTIRWKDETISSNTVTHYEVGRSKGILIENLDISNEGLLQNPNFIYGHRYLIIDKIKKVYWYGFCTFAGELNINSENIFPYINDLSDEYEMSINNINVYKEGEFEDIDLVNKNINEIDYILIDKNIEMDCPYFYSITSCISFDVKGSTIYYPIYIKNLQNITPYLRSIGNSDNQYLSSSIWRNLKNVLTDHNYYLKQQFDIPKIKGNYDFKGFVGIAGCYVDIFINKQYALTVESDIYGNFRFDLSFPTKKSLISIQARTKDNVTFSLTSTPQTIRIVTIYSFFTSLAQEYVAIWKEILQQITDFSFEEARIGSVQNKLNPFLDFIKHMDETDESYKDILVTSYLAYEYAGYEKALNMILEAFKRNIPEMDNYEIFSRDTLMNSLKSGYSLVIDNKDYIVDEDTRLNRFNYIYGVSSCKGEIGDNYVEESSIAIIRADCRWWSNKELLDDIDDYYGFNVLAWEGNADFYKIYRLDNPKENYKISDFKFLAETPFCFLIDIGLRELQDGISPPEYTITEFLKPSNLHIYYNNHLSLFNINYKNSNWVRIHIFEKANMEIEEYQLERLLTLFKDVIPPEIGYSILLCNDKRVKNITELFRPDKEFKPLPVIYYWTEGNLHTGLYYYKEYEGSFDLVKNMLGFIAYDSSYYDMDNYSYSAFFQSDVIEKEGGIRMILLTKNTSDDFCFAQYTIYDVNLLGTWYDFEPVPGTSLLRAVLPNEPTKIQIRVFFDIPNLYGTFNVKIRTID